MTTPASPTSLSQSSGKPGAVESTTEQAATAASGERPVVHVVGAGLAGSECALQLAGLGYRVTLWEMRGETMTPAHKTASCAELVCSNSFGSLATTAAPGQLKWEAECLGSEILASAWDARVPAGQALSVDREAFALEMTRRLKAHPMITIETRVVQSLDDVPRPAVIATGPLTHSALAESMRAHFGDEFLYFFDAIAPIVDADSINMDIAWRADRWDKGTKDYLNCPLNKREYLFFIDAVRNARKVEPKEFEKNTPYFESCMPIEAMIDRGPLTLRFGPMSPKGLPNPHTGNDPYAVVQLRQENRDATAYNMVGFQTKMAYGDQKEVFRLIPGLEEAEFLKLGAIHRNLYVNSPKRLSRDLSSRRDPLLFFAGQITGVEGYFESTCMGLLVARFLDRKIRGEAFAPPPRASAMGALLDAITDETRAHFQPTNINFGLLPPIPGRIDKLEKRAMQIANARQAFARWLREMGLPVLGDVAADPLVPTAADGESGARRLPSRSDALAAELRRATETNLAAKVTRPSPNPPPI